MDKIKWGLSFLVFSLVVSVLWGFIYAEGDITSVNRLSTSTSTALPITTSATTGEITTNKTETQLPITTTTITTTPTINTTTTQLQTTTSTSTLYIPETPSSLRLDGIVIPYNISTTTPTEPVKPVTPTTTTTTNTTPTTPIISTEPVKPVATSTTQVEPVIPTTPITTNSNIEVASSTTTEVKIPPPLEIPKDIIKSVTEALNIIPTTSPLIKTDEEITKLVYQDTNKDGISDYDSKYVYNMDPVKTSPVSTYEGKSINAGEKILLGFDPDKKELEKVVVEEPTTSKGEVVSSYTVREVALTEKKEVVLKGQALPNSFITIYIYSTPIMVTVKTDSNGEWQYTLNKELENGNHTVYTATVNNTGNIIAKSSPYNFLKTAEAVTLQDIAPIKSINIPTTTVERPGFLQTKNVIMIGIAFFMILGITFIFIGLLSKKKSGDLV